MPHPRSSSPDRPRRSSLPDLLSGSVATAGAAVCGPIRHLATRTALSGAAIGATLLASAGVAQAQIIDWDLGFSVRGFYDDNLLRLSEEEDPDPGESQSDFVQEYGVNGEVGLNISRQRLFLAGNATFRRHINNTQLNTTPFVLNGGWQWQAYRCDGELSGLFRETTSEIDDLEESVLNTERTLGVRQTATCPLGSEFSVGLNSSFDDTTNSLEAEASDDRRRFAVNGFVGYDVPELMAVQLGTSYQLTDFPNRDAGDALPDQSSQVGLDLRVSRDFSPTFQIGGSVGATIINGVGDSGPFPRFAFDVGWSVTPKISLSLSGGRTIDSPQTVDSALETNDVIELAADWDFTPKVDFRSVLSLTRTSFETAGDEGGLAEDREDRSFSSEVVVGYQPIDDLRLSLSYRFIDRDSTLDTSAFQSQQVSVRAAYQF